MAKSANALRKRIEKALVKVVPDRYPVFDFEQSVIWIVTCAKYTMVSDLKSNLEKNGFWFGELKANANPSLTQFPTMVRALKKLFVGRVFFIRVRFDDTVPYVCFENQNDKILYDMVCDNHDPNARVFGLYNWAKALSLI